MISINRKTLALSAILAFLAWTGNWLNMPLFYGVDFIFGSIAAMLAAALLGPVPATVIAAAGGLYTLVLWNQPYALIIFTAEALTVALLYRRGLHNLILADLVFWVFLGLPLILLFYHGFIGMEWQSTLLIAHKQPLNGLFNALVAGIILIVVQIAFRTTTPTGRVRPSLFELLFHVLLCSIILAGAIPIIVESNAQRNRHEAFMLDRLEHIAQRAAADIASAPDAAIKTWQTDLARAQLSPQTSLALLDYDGRILIEQGKLAAIEKQTGEIKQLNEDLAIWLPYGELATMDRWKRGRYLTSIPITGVADVAQVYIEQDAESLVLDFEQGRLPLFLSLAVLLVSGIIASYLLSRWLTHPLRNLEAASFGLADAIGNGLKPNLPASPIMEYDNLSKTLNEMAQRLTDSFNEQSGILARLEQQVQARTADLKQNRDQYQSLVNNIPGIVYRCKLDENWTMLYMSAIVDNISGYPASDFIANSVRSYASIIHPDDAEKVEHSVYEAVKTDQAWELEYRILHTDGTVRWAYEKGTAISDIKGNVAYLDGFILDITDRKLADTEHKQVARLLSSVLNAASEMSIIATDQLGVITTFNRGAELMLGYSAEEVVGKKTPALFHAAGEVESRGLELSEEFGYPIEGFRVFIEKPFNEGAETREWTYICKNGERIPVSLIVTSIRDENGELSGFLGIAQNIAERKQAEATLKEQNQRTKAILDNIVDGIITINCNGIIKSINPAAERIFGYTAAEAVKQNVKIFMPNPHRDAHDSYLRNYQATGVARIIGIGREVEGLRKSGELFPMELAVSEITDQGKPMYVGMVRDITERKRIDKMKNEFVSTVSHELRTPLTSITGALGLIHQGTLGELPKTVQELVDIAFKNSNRLSHLINDLLDMEKIAAGKLHFDLQLQNLIPLIEQTIEMNRTYSTERRVRIKMNITDSEAVVNVDSERLQQVVSNLLSNAVKFSPEGGEISIDLDKLNDSVKVTITDQGPGISERFRDRIFEKFAQADASDTREKSGTGLGLAISRELIERMGGIIGFDSVEGKGASFYYILPLHNREPKTESNTVLAANAPRILVVEDDPDSARLLCLMLNRAGYATDTALTGTEALEAVQSLNYACISLDLKLPDINGITLIREWRSQAATENIPIIVVSAYIDTGRLAINGDFSLIDWLTKPFDKKKLLDCLYRATIDERQEPFRILHVEDDPNLHNIIRLLNNGRFEIEPAVSLGEALALLKLQHFDFVILDLTLPDGSGWELLPVIHERQPDARIIVMSGSEITKEDAEKVESVLLKSKVSPRQLLDAIEARIQT